MGVPDDYEVALNFWPLQSRAFRFVVYRRPRADQHEPTPEGCTLRSLPVESPSSEEDDQPYSKFWTTFAPKNDFEEFICDPGDNLYLTQDFLLDELKKRSEAELPTQDFEVEGDIRERIEYTLERHEEGEERVWLEPYLLRKTGQFGYLVDFRFRQESEGPPSRRVLQLSLSLDEKFRENRDFYVERYEKIQEFARNYFHRLFPLTSEDGAAIHVQRKLQRLPAPQLDTKTYIFGGEESSPSSSQFKGIKKNGPLDGAPDEALIFFVYKEEHKPYSYDLFRAIRGDTFATFPGMSEMFDFTLGREHVRGTAIDQFDQKGVESVIQRVKEEAGEGRPVVPVVIIPWDKDDATNQEDYLYYLMKHRFLQAGLPSQFVSLNTLEDNQTLKWSASNIALAIFSKMGGVPWKVSPQLGDCLIIGIGQSHKRIDGEIHRYFAYSVLADSSGLYEDLEVLGRSREEEQYLGQFKASLLEVLREYSDQFQRFEVHSTFLLRREELDAVQDVLDTYYGEAEEATDLVGLKFNHKNKYFGYAPSSNSMVPYESTYLTLSDEDFLVWFEGLQYHRSNVKSRIGGPMHIRFFYPENDLSEEEKTNYLQDALNISGTNWRGFNAKSKPVSVYYASRIAKFFRAFDEYDFEEVDVSNMTPWFL